MLFHNATKIVRVVEDSNWEKEVVTEFITVLKTLFLRSQEHYNATTPAETTEKPAGAQDAGTPETKEITEGRSTKTLNYASVVEVLDGLLAALSKTETEEGYN